MPYINNTRLAAEILRLYSEGIDAFSEEDKQKILEEERITSGQIKLIDKVLEDGVVSSRERALLKRKGFGRNFIDKLSGSDGRNALRERVKWLREKVNAKEYLLPEKASEREKMINDLVRLKSANGISLDRKIFDEIVKPFIENVDASVQDQKASAVEEIDKMPNLGRIKGDIDPFGLGRGSAEKNDAPAALPLADWKKNIGKTRQWVTPDARYKLAFVDGNVLNCAIVESVLSDSTASVRNEDQEKFYSEILFFLKASSVMALQLVDSYSADSEELRNKIISFEKNNLFYSQDSEVKNLPDINGDGKPESLETKTYWIVKDFEFRRDEKADCKGDGKCMASSYDYSGYVVQRVVIETLDTGDEKIFHLRGGTFAFEDVKDAAVQTESSEGHMNKEVGYHGPGENEDPVAEKARKEPGYAFLFRSS